VAWGDEAKTVAEFYFLVAIPLAALVIAFLVGTRKRV
jgi:hypothetical protein